MRLLALEDLKEGMTVVYPLYGINGEILIRQNGELNKAVLKKLKALGWNYLYVEDEVSRGITANCLVSPEVRSRAIVNLRKLYLAIEGTKDKDIESIKKRKDIFDAMDACLKSVNQLVDDLVTEDISLVDIYDVKMIENYRYAHSINVLIISIVLGRSLGLNELDLHDLAIGAFFHDMGQIFLPGALLEKEGIYTEADIEMMRQHPELGYRYARNHFELPTKSFLAILQHHERYDGEGYPLKKAGEDIHFFARIVAIADVFDALTSDKAYRKGMSPVGAFKHIIQNSKKAFDPKLVKLFYEKVSPYPVGFTLHLPDGRDVIVAENREGNPLYPKVKVIKYKGIDIEEPYETILDV